MVSVAAMDRCGDNPSIRILLFASLREQAGWSEQQWHWPDPPRPTLTPEQLWQQLQLPGDPQRVRVAINHQFAALNTPLQAGDELAFLPPISGG